MVVNFVLFDDRTFDAYKEKLEKISQ